jgi:hypothetical protein
MVDHDRSGKESRAHDLYNLDAPRDLTRFGGAGIIAIQTQIRAAVAWISLIDFIMLATGVWVGMYPRCHRILSVVPVPPPYSI